MKYGYTRVLTEDQIADMQLSARCIAEFPGRH